MKTTKRPQAPGPLSYVMRQQEQYLAKRDYSIRVGEQAKSLNSVKAEVITEYRCSICGVHYATYEDALACSQQIDDDGGLKIGSLVIIPNECRYYYEAVRFATPAADPWLAFSRPGDVNAPSHFDHTIQYYQWFVVTAIHYDERDRHRVLVTLCSYFDGHLMCGWNPANGEGHDAMFRASIPHDQQRACPPTSLWWDDVVAGVKFGDLVMAAKPSLQLLREAAELADLRISTSTLL